VLAAAGLDVERRAEASGWAILALTADAVVVEIAPNVDNLGNEQRIAC